MTVEVTNYNDNNNCQNIFENRGHLYALPHCFKVFHLIINLRPNNKLDTKTSTKLPEATLKIFCV